LPPGIKEVIRESNIKTSFQSPEVWDKVMGKAVYGSDMKLPGMLYGKILRSPHPHARIKMIDLSRAEKMAG
jgi:CO/xanthine dehydrogenase Mo-binding subunit